MRFHDPWQVAVEDVTDGGNRSRLASNVALGRHGEPMRYHDGVPLLGLAGDYHFRTDGTLVVPSEPRFDTKTGTMHFAASIDTSAPCYGRGFRLHRCVKPEPIEFVTPRSNVASLRVRPGEPRVPPEGPPPMVGH